MLHVHANEDDGDDQVISRTDADTEDVIVVVVVVLADTEDAVVVDDDDNAGVLVVLVVDTAAAANTDAVNPAVVVTGRVDELYSVVANSANAKYGKAVAVTLTSDNLK